MFRVIRGKYAKIVLETHAVFVYCVNARRAACGKGRGRGCVLFAFASAAPDPFLVEPKHLPVSTAPAQGLNTFGVGPGTRPTTGRVEPPRYLVVLVFGGCTRHEPPELHRR